MWGVEREEWSDGGNGTNSGRRVPAALAVMEMAQQPAAESSLCPNRGMPLVSEATFCPECGKNVAQGTATASDTTD